MRTRLLAPGFVTVVALTSGCHHDGEANSSGKNLRKRKVTEPAGSAAQRPSMVDLSNADVLNPSDAKGRTIYAVGASCFVRAAPGKYPGTYKTEFVDCPKSMDDPAWDQCSGGEIWRDKSGRSCACVQSGNPPPPTTAVPCPKQ